MSKPMVVCEHCGFAASNVYFGWIVDCPKCGQGLLREMGVAEARIFLQEREGEKLTRNEAVTRTLGREDPGADQSA